MKITIGSNSFIVIEQTVLVQTLVCIFTEIQLCSRTHTPVLLLPSHFVKSLVV